MTRACVRARWLHLARLALADLLCRRTATSLNVAQVAVATCCLLVLGSYSIALFRREQEALVRCVPTRVVASGHASDRARRFTEARCAQLRGALRGVRLLYPHVEIPLVRVQLSGPETQGQVAALPAEGLLPEDPMLAAGAFVAGGRFAGADARQAVLSRTLFERLGGTVSRGGLAPLEVLVAVERTHAGVPQTQEVTLAVAGLLENTPAPDRIFLPIDLAVELDLWATGQLADFLGQRGAPTAWPGAVAYADPAHEQRVAEEARAQGAELVRESVLEPVLEPPLDGVIHRRDATALLGAARAQLIGECRTRQLGEVLEDDGDESGIRIRVDSTTQLRKLTERCAGGAYAVRWLHDAPIRALVRYQVKDPRRSDGLIGSDLIQSLALSRPTFVAARPRLALSARVAEQEVMLRASDGKDPERLAAPLRAGAWLSTGGRDLVVPEVLALPPGAPASVTVQRTGPAGRAERLTLPLRVVGVRAGPEGFLPQDLAQDLLRWQRGELHFDEARGEFESRIEASLHFGHVRCKVYADSVDAVPAVVRQLQALGYRTEDHLAEQQGLRDLGSALVFGLVLFAGGLLLSAAASVLLSAWLHVKNRMHEIGIVRAHGVRTREVALMFAVQGLTLGALAFAGAVALVALGQPWFHRVVERVLGGGGVQASVFNAGSWWLLPLALGVCLLFALLGVILPAVYACRLTPAAALRRKE